jgi:hypothetical protein
VPSFLTNAEFLVRYDARWVGKQLLDTGAVSVPSDIADPAGAGGAVVAEFIAEASELVMAAAAVGARYTEDDLTTHGGKLLKRLVADLAMGLILKRRVRASKDEDSFSLPYREALDYLEQLRRGERIFYQVPDVPEAGLPGTADMLPGAAPGLSASARAQRLPCPISENSRIFGDIFTRGC